MTVPASAALLEALALQRAPRSRRPGPEQRLPEGTLQLVRIAAGEEEATKSAQSATGENPQVLREAAIFYIQQVCFAPGSSSYRVLGVDPDASDEKLREHYRWLARWLHPDRNPDPWEVVFAERVNRAWRECRTAEHRRRYQPTAEERDEGSTRVAAPPSHVFQQHEEAPLEPPRRRDLGWVPAAVVATLGSVAIAVVVLFYASQRGEAPASSVAEAQPMTPLELPSSALAPAPVVMTQPAPQSVPAVELAHEPAPAPPLASVPEAVTPPPPVEIAPKPAPVAPPAPRPIAVAAPPPKPAAVPSGPKPSNVSPPPVVGAAVAIPAPAPARDTTPAPEVVETARVEPAQPNSGDANRLLGQLSRAYENGDVQGMRAPFAADAHGPAGNLESILAEYRRVFAESSERSLAVRDVSWFVSGDTFTIVASFEAVVTEGRAGRVRRTRGDLRLDLRRENDRWQIFRMQHGERPG